jgi:hypothetical protein
MAGHLDVQHGRRRVGQPGPDDVVHDFTLPTSPNIMVESVWPTGRTHGTAKPVQVGRYEGLVYFTNSSGGSSSNRDTPLFNE